MALTNIQLLSLGFKPSIRGRGGLGKTKKYDSLVLPINDTDFLYTGYNPYKKDINYKTIWKSFRNYEGERITYQVVNLSDTGFNELKNYINRTVNINIEDTEELVHSSAYVEQYDNPLAVAEASEGPNEMEGALDTTDKNNSTEGVIDNTNIENFVEIKNGKFNLLKPSDVIHDRKDN